MSHRGSDEFKAEDDLAKAYRILVTACPIEHGFAPQISTVEQLEEIKESDPSNPSDPKAQTVLTKGKQFYAVMAPGQRGQGKYQEDAFSCEEFSDATVFEQTPENLTSVIASAVCDYAASVRESFLTKYDDDQITNCPGTTLSLAVQVSTPEKTDIYTANIGDSLTVLATRSKRTKGDWALTPLNWQHHASDTQEQKRIKGEGGILRYLFADIGDPLSQQTVKLRSLNVEDATAIYLDVRGKSYMEPSRSIGDALITGHSFEPSSTMVSVDHQEEESILLQLTDGIFATDPTKGLTLPQINQLINQPAFRENSDQWGALLTQEVEQQSGIVNGDNKTILVTPIRTDSAVMISSVADEHRIHTAELAEDHYKESGTLSNQVVQELPAKVIQYLQYPKQIGHFIAEIEAHSFNLKYAGGKQITINGQPKKVSKTASAVYQTLTNEKLNGDQRIEQAIQLLTPPCNQKISSHRFLRLFTPRHSTTQLFYQDLLNEMQENQPPSIAQHAQPSL